MFYRGLARFDWQLNRQFRPLLYQFNVIEAILFDMSVNFAVKGG